MPRKSIICTCALLTGWLLLNYPAAAGPNEPLSISSTIHTGTAETHDAALSAGRSGRVLDRSYAASAPVRSALSRSLSQAPPTSYAQAVPPQDTTSWGAPKQLKAPRHPTVSSDPAFLQARARLTNTEGNRPLTNQSTELQAGDPANTARNADLSVAEQLPLGQSATTWFQEAGQANTDQTDTGRSSWWLNTMTGLGIVIGLIFLLRAVVAKASAARNGASSNPAVEVLSRVSLAPRNQVLLIKLGKRVLVVGESPAGLRTLAEVNEPEEVADLLATATAAKPRSLTRSFTQLLQRFNTDYRDDQRRIEEGDDQDEYLVDRARDQVSGLLWRVRSKLHSG